MLKQAAVRVEMVVLKTVLWVTIIIKIVKEAKKYNRPNDKTVSYVVDVTMPRLNKINRPDG